MSERRSWFGPACAALVLSVAAGPVQSAWAQTAGPATTSPDTTLPPLSPPVDVPMHVPQPPRDGAAPLPSPNAQTTPARAPVELAQHGGTITPIAPHCRDATYRVVIDGRPETAIAHLCRTADGRWRLAP